MGASAAGYCSAIAAMDAGCTIEQAFVLSRLVAHGVLDVVINEQSEFYANIQIVDRAFEFQPDEAWIPDFEDLAREFKTTFDRDACLAFEAKVQAAD